MIRKFLPILLLSVIFLPPNSDAQSTCNDRNVCGGLLGKTCNKGFTCVLNVDSSCSSSPGGSDCEGICAAAPVVSARCTDGKMVLPSKAVEAKASAQLSLLSPTASIVWNKATGTFKNLETMNFEVQNCAGSRDVFNLLKTQLFASFRGLFQMSPTEWNSNNVLCSAVLEGQTTVLRLDRYKMGRHLVTKDYMLVYLTRMNGSVRVSSITAAYLPIISNQQDADLAACPELSLSSAWRGLQKHKFEYTVFAGCIAQFKGIYLPNSDDVVVFDSERLGVCNDSWWTWSESTDSSGVILRKVRRGALRIGNSNIGEKIISSNLNCPVYRSPAERIFGYEIQWHSATGEIFSVLPGIGCIVC